MGKSVCLNPLETEASRTETRESALPAAEFRQSDAQLRAIFEGAAIGITLADLSGRPVKCNPALERLLGYTQAELRGMTFAEFTHPDDLPADLAFYHRILSGELDHYQIEKRFIRKDGRIVWARLTVSLVSSPADDPRFAVGMVEDITAQKAALAALNESEGRHQHAESALRRSEERLRRALDASRMGAWEWDIPNDHVSWNDGVHSLFGVAPGEFGGTFAAFLELVHPDDRQRVQRELNDALKNPDCRYYSELRVTWRDGGVHWLEGRGEVQRDAMGKPIRMLGTVVDITDRKRLEESLQQAQKRELSSREEFARQLLNAGEQERQSLAAELHDSLGQNLSLITNRLYLALAQPGLAPKVVDHLKAISVLTSEAINEVRNLARNLRPLQIEQLGLSDSIRELVEKTLAGSPLRFDVRIENVDDAIEEEAATHLYRIVQEALNNLIKHSGADRATFTLERDITSIRLRLSDNGRGFHVNRPARPAGLGLISIAERAHILGGNASIQSSPGAGTRLTVELPIHGLEPMP